MTDSNEKNKYESILRDALEKISHLTAKLKRHNEPIAIIGMSCRFPGGANSPQAYWELLERGGDAISDIPASRWDADDFYDPDPETPGKMITKSGGFLDVDVGEFDASFFNISPKEAEYLDPQQRLLLEVSYEAILSSGIDKESLEGSLTGVFIGLCTHDYMDLITGRGDLELINPYLMTGNSSSTATGRISYTFGFQGPNFAIDTACSSSLVAIDEACQSLRSGNANLALAGGVNLILAPNISIDFSKAGMLAPDGHCKTFDASADGYARGEGCGVIVLKRLSDAVRDGNRVLAVIKGSGINQDGASSGLTVPNGAAQEALMRSVLAKAKLVGADIDYVEAHGTGTPLGDPIEVRAMGAVYGARDTQHVLRFGSVKTNIGHLEGAAGIASVIKVILALQHETLPGQLHFKTLNPQIDLNFPGEVVSTNQAWPRSARIRRAAVSSFGFSGTNGHLILEEGPALTEAFNPAMPVFNRQHYWAEEAKVHLGRPLNSVHPLLGERHTSPNGDLFFLGSFNLSDLAYIKDHQIFDYIICPGVGYLEMLFAAARYGVGQGEVYLTDVVFEKALRLEPSKSTEMQVIMTSEADGYDVVIYSENDDKTWTSHAKGTVLATSPAEAQTPLNITDIKARCNLTREPHEIYGTTNSGMKLGACFQTIKAVYFNEKEALAQIKASTSIKGYLSHPALFDSAMQLLGMFPFPAEHSELYLPVNCDAVYFYSPLEEEGYVHLELTEVTDMNKSGNLSVCSLSGEVLIRLVGVHFRHTTEAALKKVLAEQKPIDGLLYEWVWQNKAQTSGQAAAPAGHWLILGQGEVAEVLSRQLQEKGVDCRLIVTESMPKSKEGFTELLNAGACDVIVHVSSMDEAAMLSAQSIKEVQESGLRNVLYLTQALIDHSDVSKIQLALVTQNSSTTNLTQSPLNGFVKTVLAEQPGLKLKQIDLGDAWDAGVLLELLCADEDETLYQLQEKKCLVPRLVKLSAVDDASRVPARIKTDATYLITGGLGGLGLTLAKWLIAQGAGALVLTGRRPLDEGIQAQLRDLEQGSTVITYESLDMNEEQAVAGLLSRLHNSVKPLKGIFHLAGILDDALLVAQDWAHFDRVFAAKVYGSWYLHQYAKDLDLFVLFSSIASSLGSPGQSNYAAANAFMDALAYYRRTNGLPAHSLSWGPWAEVGMAKDLLTRHATGGFLGIKPQEGMQALEMLLGSDNSTVTIAHIDWKKYGKQLIEVPAWLELLVQRQKKGHSLRDQIESLEPSMRLPFIKRYVSDAVRVALSISTAQELDEKKGFFDLGMDSLMAIELKNRLQSEMGKTAIIASTVVFDHSSVEKMTNYLATLLNIENLSVRKKEEPQRVVQSDEPIAIIGMSCRFPGGANDVDSYWDLIEGGRDGTSDVPPSRWDADSFYDADRDAPGKMITKRGGFLSVDVSAFDATYFGISPREADYLDPQQRLLLEVSAEALACAGLDLSLLEGSQTGVFIGICSHDYMMLLTSTGDRSLINAYMATGGVASTATGRISYFFDFQGPNFAIDTACSSSLVAIHEACKTLRTGEANLALAGGVNLILTPDLSIDFSKAGMLAPDGLCKTFDASADGYVRGEGCGVIVLKRLSDAVRDGNHVLAVIKGSGINQDGASSGLTVPNGAAQEALMRQVLANAKLVGSDIDYVEAHGTGTPLGDPIEVRAIGAVYGARDTQHVLRFGSVKTNIGHLEGAAGIASVIKVILALQHETLPGQLHFKTLNPQIDLNFPGEVASTNQAWPRSARIRRAAVSSFGFSGTNGHLILEEGPVLTEALTPAMPVFNRQHYWAEEAKVHLGRSLHSVHPLLGERHTSPNGDVFFLGSFNLSDLAYIKDHQIYDYIICPGVGYLEMLFAAAQYGAGQGEVYLTDVVFEKALHLEPSKSTEMQVIMTSEADGYDVVIYSENDDKTWTSHARGTVLAASPAEAQTPLNITDIKARCNLTREPHEVYGATNGGMTLGTCFQTIKAVYFNEKEALARIKASTSIKGYLSHPALFDSAMQLLAVFPFSAEHSELYLPVSCDAVHFYSPLEEEGYVHLELTELTDMNKSGNLTVCSLSGKVLIRLVGVHFRHTTEAALKKVLAEQNPIDGLLYEWVWQNKAQTSGQAAAPAGHWLILGQGEVTEVLSRQLQEKGVDCRLIVTESIPKSKEGFTELLNAGACDVIVHVSSMDEAAMLSAQSIKEVQESGLRNVLYLTQALIDHSDVSKIQLALVTQNSSTTNLTQSPLNGFVKTVLAEQPGIKLKQIDLGDAWDVGVLLELLCADEDETRYQLHGKECLVPRLVRLSVVDDASRVPVHIRTDATYLITGGLGGLGLTLAKWLIAQGAGALVLTGRRPLDEGIQAQLRDLEQGSTVITYESLDMNEEQAVAGLLSRLHNSVKPLKGIFHLAGILDDALLVAQDWAHFDRVFAAKVYGSWYLHQYAKDLDLFVLFSSIASSLGSPGQSNYAAANAFMDALAYYRRTNGLPAHSLSWGPWAEVGMAKDLLTRHATGGFLGIKPQDGMQALEMLLGTEHSTVTIARIDWNKLTKQMIVVPSWYEFLIQIKTHKSIQLKGISKTKQSELVRSLVSDCMQSVLGASLGERMDQHANFFDQGLDSLMAIEFKNRLQLGLGAVFILSPSCVFDYPTIKQMTDYIVGHISTDETKITDLIPAQSNRVTTLTSTKWVVRQQVIESPALRVFCFHHAGGSASAFRGWQQKMPQGVELCAIQLPGREERSGEPLIHELNAVVYGVLHGIIPLLDKPFIFFGHSMGAMLAYQIAEMLHKLGLPTPTQLILSGFTPLQLNNKKSAHRMESSKLDDAHLISFAEGIPDDTLQNPEAMAIILALIRADLSLLSGPFLSAEPLDIPISTVYAIADKVMTEEEVLLWSKATTGACRHHRVPGSHVELLSNPNSYIEVLLGVLNQVVEAKNG